MLLGDSTSPKNSSQSFLDEFSLDDDDVMSFEEMLGYNTDDYHSRANTDLDYYDIDVKSKDDTKGVSFFEDYESDTHNSDFINDLFSDDDSDYFDDFFSGKKDDDIVEEREHKQPTKSGEGIMKRCSNFSKNLSRMISDRTKSKRK